MFNNPVSQLLHYLRFVEAQRAFHQAGRPDQAFRVLQELTVNAVNENRFDDASYYYWVLARQDLDMAREAEDPAPLVAKFREHHAKASIYHAYHTIQRYTDEPFTSYMPEALFNISRYLLHELVREQPKGVSKFAVLYALAKQVDRKLTFSLPRPRPVTWGPSSWRATCWRSCRACECRPGSGTTSSWLV